MSDAIPAPPPPRADLGRRFVAVVIDVVVLGVIGGVFNAIVEPEVANGLSLVLGLAYFTFLEGSPAGQTVGKKVMDIRVIDLRTSGSLGMGKAFIRWISRYLSAIPCGLGYLWAFWDPERQTWHDKLAGTVVVPVEAHPVSSWP